MSRTSGIDVLHVDDDVTVAELTAEMLQRADDQFSIDTATSTTEGLDRLAGKDFDCIVSDYDMPNRNGIAFLEAVREEYPELPFILYTAKGSESVASDAIAAGATDYLQKGTGTDQYELLANRIRNAVEQYRARRRAADLDRIRALVGDINQALVRADSRSQIETRVCERLSESDGYLFAWIGAVDAETDRVEPRAWAGVEKGYLEDVTITADETATGHGPGGTALRERRVAVVQNVDEDPAFEPWRDAALEREFRSVAAIPLAYDDTLYGLLSVYADRPDAFDEDERALLTELGDDISHAVHSVTLQAAVREEREFIDQSLDTLHDIFYVAGADGSLQRWNDRLLEVTGYTDEEIADMHGLDFFVDGDRAKVADAVERTLTNGAAKIEASVLTKGGDRIPYEFNGQRLTDPEGEVIGIIGTGRDVSERATYERQLREKRNLLEEIFEQIPTHLFVKDTEGRHLQASAHHLASMPYDPEDMIGHTDVEVAQTNPDVFSHEHATESYEDDMRVIDTEEPIINKEEYLPPPEDEWNLTSKVPWYDAAGQLQGVMGVSRRITKRKEYEQELQRQNDRLERFTSIVSHDLRNPLNVAIGRLELGEDGCESDHHEDVAEALERMEVLIEDLLALARAGGRIDETKPVDLASTSEDCWRTVATADATLVVDTEQTIEADASRLRQLLENLVRNAIEHGGDDVTITVGDLEGGFYVADDGPGIPEDEREEVFEPGYSTTRDGTGFGLNIVRETADGHGWEVTLERSAAGGARFEFTGVERPGQ